MTKKNIYFANLLRSGKYNFTSEDNWLMTQLLAVSQEASVHLVVSSFSEKLLELFHRHSFYSKLDRVCLAKLLAPVHELMVLSSQNSDRVKKNLIPLGYRCFVGSNGTLFNIKPNMIRIYSDAAQVMKSYQEEGRPPQRSIRYVYEMGIRSGLCLPIFVKDRVGGFVFLNSIIEGLFDDLRDEDYAILSLIQVLASHMIMIYEHATYNLLHDYKEQLPQSEAMPFEKTVFADQLQTFFEKVERPCQFLIQMHKVTPFLYSPARLVYLMAVSVLLLEIERPQLVIHVMRQGEDVRCQIEHGLTVEGTSKRIALESIYRTIVLEASMLGILFEMDNYHVTYSFPHDHVYQPDASVLYSV